MRTFGAAVFRWGVVCCIVVPVWAQLQPAQSGTIPKCAIRGIVTHLLSGIPVKKATVQLASVENEAQAFNSSAMAALGVPMPAGKSGHSTTSASDGSFCFEDVTRGQYMLSASKVGFLSTKYGAESPGESGKSVTVGGESDRVFSLALIPHAVVSGKVLDGDEEPVSGAYVNLLARTWVNGHPRNVAVRGGQTNDLGEFRVAGLAPGTYYVRVDPRSEDPSSTDSNRGFLRTFYPGVTAATEATPIVVTAGAEISGVGVRMLYGQKHHVRGSVVGLSASDQGGVTLLPEGEEQLFLGVGAGSLKPDGTFDFPGVTPGTYTLRYIEISGEAAKGGRRTVEVADRDVDNIAITATMPATVRGRVRFEGTPSTNAQASGLKPLSVALIASDVLVGPGAAAAVQADGTFVIRNIITPGRYIVRCDPPSGAYLKSVRYGQANVATAEIDILDGTSGEMEIVYRYGLATLTGSVTRPADGSGAPSKADPAHIVLVPDELDPAGRGIIFRSAGDDGTFSLSSVPPGRYRAYAFESVDYSALHHPPVLKAIESLGGEVELIDGASKSISLEFVSADKARRVIAVAVNQ